MTSFLLATSKKEASANKRVLTNNCDSFKVKLLKKIRENALKKMFF